MTNETGHWRRVRNYARQHGGRRIAHELVSAFGRNRVLTYASAVSFQVLFALVPLLLAGIAVLGFLDLEGIWNDTLAPRLRDRVSAAVFEVVDRSVESVLGTRRGFWLTLGAGLALWQISGGVRATMAALNDIYGAEETRPFLRRVLVSLALALALALLLGLAAVAVHVAPRVAASLDLGGAAVLAVAAAWALALALMVAAVALTMRFAPVVPQPHAWLGFGTALVLVGWSATSIAFAAWTTRVASYSAIYGSLGVAILLLTYINLSALVFLGAAQVDALVRRYAGDEP